MAVLSLVQGLVLSAPVLFLDLLLMILLAITILGEHGVLAMAGHLCVHALSLSA